MPTPFRPTAADLALIGGDVAPISDIQKKLVANHPHLTMRDRVAHQYQIAGGKVFLRIEPQLPQNFVGVGLFEPGAQHIGIGRISTGLGCPHLETDLDFLGLMVAFQTRAGKRVDFLTINDPTSPTDTHPQFVTLLDATADAAGVQAPFGSGLGELDLPDLAASNLRLIQSLIKSLGLVGGGKVAAHVVKQTLTTALSLHRVPDLLDRHRRSRRRVRQVHVRTSVGREPSPRIDAGRTAPHGRMAAAPVARRHRVHTELAAVHRRTNHLDDAN